MAFYTIHQTPDVSYIRFEQFYKIPPGLKHFFKLHCPGSEFNPRTNSFSYNSVHQNDVLSATISHVDQPRVPTTLIWYGIDTDSVKIDQDELIIVNGTNSEDWSWNPDVWHNVKINEIDVIVDKYKRRIQGLVSITVESRPEAIIFPIPDSKSS